MDGSYITIGPLDDETMAQLEAIAAEAAKSLQQAATSMVREICADDAAAHAIAPPPTFN